MARKLLFTELDELFASGKDFEISDARYKEITGNDLPKSPYLKSRSALAKKAKENGYSITVKEEPVIIKKVVFKKGFVI